MPIDDFDFDEAWYLAKYPDVKQAIDAQWMASGLAHYQSFGRAEGRTPAPPTPAFSPLQFCRLSFEEKSAISWALMDIRSERPVAPAILERLRDAGIIRITNGSPTLTAAGRALTSNDISVNRLKSAALRMIDTPVGA
jgi:hypothetical protein